MTVAMLGIPYFARNVVREQLCTFGSIWQDNVN